jgi:putative colanic acid biosynthesis UDP-glucose lipid carrier transferase
MAQKGYSRFLALIHCVGDISVLNCAFVFAYILVNRFAAFNDVANEYILLHIVFNLAWAVVTTWQRDTDVSRNTGIEVILWKTLKSVAIHALIIFAAIAVIKGNYFSRAHLLFTYGIFLIGLYIWRISYFYALRRYRKKGSNFRNVVVIGAGIVGHDIYKYISADDGIGYKLLGFFEDNPDSSFHPEKVLGGIKDFEKFVTETKVDQVFIAIPLTQRRVIREIISIADNNLVRVKIVPDFRGFLNKKVNMKFYDMVPVLTVRPEPLQSLLNRFFKRAFDIAFSSMVLIFIFPWLFPILALMIKLSSPGPVFFVQKRSGRRNEVFSCLKFRSMSINKDSDHVQATQNDTRITWVGRMLRKSNMDELPQFINVLMGQMSIVGPRPHMLKHTQDYSQVVDKFMVRHLVKPGITGLAQVKGYRGPTENKRRMYKRVLFDVWYVENWTLMLDIKIIFLTVFNMFRGEKNAF